MDVKVGDKVIVTRPNYRRSTGPDVGEYPVVKVARTYFYVEDGAAWAEPPSKFYIDSGREYTDPNENGYYAATARTPEEHAGHDRRLAAERNELLTGFRRTYNLGDYTVEQLEAIVAILEGG